MRQLESSPEGGPSQAAAAKPESEAQAPADEKEEEADDGLNDLLICLGQASAPLNAFTCASCFTVTCGLAAVSMIRLGNRLNFSMRMQEEQKVERLRAKLEEMGVDVDVLLEGIGNDEQDDEEAGAADEHEDLT